METKTKRDELNKIYRPLYTKAANILSCLKNRGFEAETGWYGGHYSKDENGEYREDYFPIPVISVKNLCDIETGIDMITVSAKLKRGDALSLAFEDIPGVPFEAYGVENYLSDYYTEGMTKEQFYDNIRDGGEKEIGFGFIFDQETDGNSLCELAEVLKSKGFYY